MDVRLFYVFVLSQPVNLLCLFIIIVTILDANRGVAQ